MWTSQPGGQFLSLGDLAYALYQIKDDAVIRDNRASEIQPQQVKVLCCASRRPGCFRYSLSETSGRSVWEISMQTGNFSTFVTTVLQRCIQGFIEGKFCLTQFRKALYREDSTSWKKFILIFYISLQCLCWWTLATVWIYGSCLGGLYILISNLKILVGTFYIVVHQ